MCFPAAPMASGMAAVMLEKQHERWDRVLTAPYPSIIVKRCYGPTLDRLRTEAQMGENGGRTTGQVLSHGTYTCLAWCFMFLAHIHRVGSAGLAVTDDRNGHCRKILILQGSDSKGYPTVPRCADTGPARSALSWEGRGLPRPPRPDAPYGTVPRRVPAPRHGSGTRRTPPCILALVVLGSG